MRCTSLVKQLAKPLILPPEVDDSLRSMGPRLPVGDPYQVTLDPASLGGHHVLSGDSCQAGLPSSRDPLIGLDPRIEDFECYPLMHHSHELIRCVDVEDIYLRGGS